MSTEQPILSSSVVIFNELTIRGISVVAESAKTKLLLVSMGACAKALTYDLYLDGYQVIDVGNLDIEYEWFLRGANEFVQRSETK